MSCLITAVRILKFGTHGTGRSATYPNDIELRQYFQHVAEVWNLSKDVKLRTCIVEARWQNDRWFATRAGGDKYDCKWLLSCTGTSFKQYIPGFKGKEKFQGKMHHSSLWPEEGVEMKDKRVVIGAGSTGI